MKVISKWGHGRWREEDDKKRFGRGRMMGELLQGPERLKVESWAEREPGAAWAGFGGFSDIGVAAEGAELTYLMRWS